MKKLTGTITLLLATTLLLCRQTNGGITTIADDRAASAKNLYGCCIFVFQSAKAKAGWMNFRRALNYLFRQRFSLPTPA